MLPVMCGRYTLTTPTDELAEHLLLGEAPALAPRYNVAPQQDVPCVRLEEGTRRLRLLRWGLVPPWLRPRPRGRSRRPLDPDAPPAGWINARAETAADRPAFRSAYRNRRCLVPADGFYEWKPRPQSRGKVPHYFYLAGGGPFCFAGIWERWRSPSGEELLSCAILTTRPNALLAEVHERMPVILAPEAYGRWLTAGPDELDALRELLEPFPAERMAAHPVSRLVNDPTCDRPGCIEPASAPGGERWLFGG